MKRSVALVVGAIIGGAGITGCNAGNTLSGAASALPAPSTVPAAINVSPSPSVSPQPSTLPGDASTASPAPTLSGIIRRPGY